MWGSLGDIVFEIHKTPIKGSLIRKNRFNYAKIETYEKPKLQFLREDLEEIEFEIRFCLLAGIDPEEEMKKLRQEARKKEPLTLIIGEDIVGKFVIEEIEQTYNVTDNKGKPIDVGVKIKLLEYR